MEVPQGRQSGQFVRAIILQFSGKIRTYALWRFVTSLIFLMIAAELFDDDRRKRLVNVTVIELFEDALPLFAALRHLRTKPLRHHQ